MKTIRIPFTTEAYERLVVTEKRGKVVREQSQYTDNGLVRYGEFQPVEIYTLNSKDPLFPIVGSYFMDEQWQHGWWGPEGIEGDGDTEQALFIEYEAKSLGWFNFYADDSLHRSIKRGTKKEADKNAFDDRIACIEVFEGEGLLL